MSNIEGKYEIEFNFASKDIVFLNYWDNIHGNDVIATFTKGKLMHEGEEISLEVFIELVKQSIKKGRKL